MILQNYYKAVCLVGQGSYGNVYKCKVQVGHPTSCPSPEEPFVAVKKFKKPGMGIDKNTHRRSNKCKRELQMLKLVSENPHPHVVRLLDYFSTQTGKLCLVFEHVDQTLLQVLEQHPRGMRENDAKRIIWQLLGGLKELHMRNIMHRDIKPENLLINGHGIIKICDLGFARFDPSDDEGQTGEMSVEMTQYISTRWYRAPELLLRHKTYTKSVDIWSVGCILIEILSGTPAFPGNNDVGVLGMILESVGNVPQDRGQEESQRIMLQVTHLDKKNDHTLWFSKWLRSLSTELQSFISMCLKTDHRERATVEDLLNHEWLVRSNSEWKTKEFKHNIYASMLQTKSVHAVVMACKRLRMATGHESVQEKATAMRRRSTKDFMLSAYKGTPKSPLLPFENRNAIKHGYYTPQVEGPRCPAEMKDQSTRYWLETPGGAGMMSPKLNEHCVQKRLPKASPSPREIEACEDQTILNTESGETPTKQQKRTMAKKIGGMIQKIFQ